MKLIDRLALITALYFVFYFVCCFSMDRKFAACLAAALAAAAYHALALIMKRHRFKKERSASERSEAEAFLRSVPFMEEKQARAVFLDLIRTEAQVLISGRNGALCLANGKKYWIGFYLKHPEAAPAGAQEMAEVLKESRLRSADRAVLIALHSAPAAPPADPALSAVHIAGRETVLQFCLRHRDILPKAPSVCEEKPPLRNRIRRVFFPAFGRSGARRHMLYALMLLPGALLSRSPVLLFCIALQIYFALYALFGIKKKASAGLFD